MTKRKERRPWIRVLNARGQQVQRCKSPELATSFFVHYYWGLENRRMDTALDGARLFLDGYEYNPPIVEVWRMRFPIKPKDWEEHKALVLDKMKYLIDLHKSFYY